VAGCTGVTRVCPIVIRATAPTITAAATNIWGVIGSPANAQPSATATTGFTYA
jgi:hypothetical protein